MGKRCRLRPSVIILVKHCRCHTSNWCSGPCNTAGMWSYRMTLASGSAAFIESCAAIGRKDCDSVILPQRSDAVAKITANGSATQFKWKLCFHWLKFLRQHHVAVVIQGALRHHTISGHGSGYKGFVFRREGYQLPAPSQCWLMKKKYFFIFHKKNQSSGQWVKPRPAHTTGYSSPSLDASSLYQLLYMWTIWDLTSMLLNFAWANIILNVYLHSSVFSEESACEKLRPTVQIR